MSWKSIYSINKCNFSKYVFLLLEFHSHEKLFSFKSKLNSIDRNYLKKPLDNHQKSKYNIKLSQITPNLEQNFNFLCDV